jgi:hypothetical protein
MKKISGYQVSHAISFLADVVIACHVVNPKRARGALREAAVSIGVELDVPGESAGGLRVVQELALTAAKALCEVRAPAVHGNPSHPDTRERAADVAESLEQARANIVSAWEILCGRRPV